jgi:HK97 family phage portal protein
MPWVRARSAKTESPAPASLPPPPAGTPGRLETLLAEVIDRRLDTDDLAPWELPVVVACRRLLADTVGQLPLVALRGRRPIATQPPLVVRPNRREYRWLTMHRATNQLTQWGYCWCLVTDLDATGRPAAVRMLDASDATATFDPVTGELDQVWHNGDELTPGLDILWVPYDVQRRASLGESPLGGCWRAVEYLCAMWSMAGSFWEAGFPSLAIQVVHRLSPGQAQELKSQVVGSWRRKHEPAVIDGDGKLAPIGASPLEAQLVESIGAANAEIARAFGMPASLVNVAAGDSLTYATTESEFNRWLSTGLGSYLMRFEATFSDLLPDGVTARFNTNELARSDFGARVEAYATTLGGAPWLTVDEVRDREGLDPLDDTTAPTPASSEPALT